MKTQLTLLLGLLLSGQIWASNNSVNTRPVSQHYQLHKTPLTTELSPMQFLPTKASPDLLPDTIKMYEYNVLKNTWTLYNTDIQHYNNKGQLIEIIGNEDKKNYKYDANGQKIEIVELDKIGSSFVNDEKQEYRYDSILTDYLIERTQYDWLNNVWVNVYQHKKTIDWNANKNANSETISLKDGDTFAILEKTEITYGADQKANRIVSLYWNQTQGSLAKQKTYTDIVWHAWGGNFLNDLYFGKNQLASATIIGKEDESTKITEVVNYSDTGFISITTTEGKTKEEYVYTLLDERGSYNESIIVFAFSDTSYMPIQGKKAKEIVDEHDNLILSESYSYDVLENTWVLDDAIYMPIIYDKLGRIIQLTIIQGFWDAETNSVISDTLERWHYYYNEGVAIESAQTAQKNWIAYPNPSRDYFQLQGILPIQEITIYTLSGQNIRSFKNINPYQKIDVSNLPKGLYILSAKSKNSIENIRWVKL
ncbi:MAG: T9SS type A sorting domain-containing protein [Bacteroidales bacterium]